MSQSVYINNLASFLPNAPVVNQEMEAILGQVGDKSSRAKSVILRSNKIKKRHYAIDPATGEFNYTNAQLAAKAVQALFDDGQPQIDCLVASTSLPDQIMPNHGVMVHGELGLEPCEVVSTAGICLCGVSALKYAYMNVKGGDAQQAAVVASELASNAMHAGNFAAENQHQVTALEKQPELAFEKDFLRWMLSDGAGAALLSAQANTSGLSLRIDWIDIYSFANRHPACMYAGAEKVGGQLVGWSRYTAQEREQQSILSVKQDVRLLNDNIVKTTLEDGLQKSINKHNLHADEFRFFLPHYSSNYFRELAYKGLENIGFSIPYEKWFTNLSDKGNTGSASIFIMLAELFHSGQLNKGDKLLCYVPESGRFSSAFIQLTAV